MSNPYFTNKTFKFLKQLAQNNQRDWFNEHKQDYEDCIRTPALNFIEDFTDELMMISPHFQALPKKVGGSLMRVYRDVRFSKDKSPYKLNIGLRFRHERAKDVHSPGFYVHIEPGNNFIGAGIWRPDSDSLGNIRDWICEKESLWLEIKKDKAFNKIFKLGGDTLIRPPKGYDKEHPLIVDLKRKDFIAIAPVSNKFILDKDFRDDVFSYFSAADIYMQFLCDALELRY